ncbi:UNVERIFIED_ORG: hypothetical protein M2348_001341 [Sphingomonas sp. R1F5B]
MIGFYFARAWTWLANLLAPILLPALLVMLVICAGGWAWLAVRVEGLHVGPIKITGLRTERDQWRSAEHDWRRAATIMRGSYDTLHGALGMQKAAVQRLKTEGDAREAAGKAARDATAPRNAVRERLARAIEMASPSSVGTCRTPAAVMAAKGEL